MKLLPAKKADAPAIELAINEEFPYVSFSQQKIQEKLESPNFFILKAVQGNIFMGFAELEIFLEKDEARLNAVWVDVSWRGKKIATKLVERLLHEARHRHINRVFLLVKEENSAAKALYKKTGFLFEKPHDKIIEGSKVEVWSKQINKSAA